MLNKKKERELAYVVRIDDMGQLHGSWGGLAVIPGEDIFTIISC